jgi:hypothetical protein
LRCWRARVDNVRVVADGTLGIVRGVQAALEVCITTSGSCGSGTSPLLTTLLPTVVGALLGFFAALLLRRRERVWEGEREWFDRERTQARELDDALVKTQLRIQEQGVAEDEDRWAAAHREWEQGWVRVTPFLDSRELEARYRAVGTILLELRFYEGNATIIQRVNVVQRAIANARQALAYFVRGHDLPDASFPDVGELLDLLGAGDPDSLVSNGPLRKWLDDHPEGPWHPETKGDDRYTKARRRFPWLGQR